MSSLILSVMLYFMWRKGGFKKKRRNLMILAITGLIFLFIAPLLHWILDPIFYDCLNDGNYTVAFLLKLIVGHRQSTFPNVGNAIFGAIIGIFLAQNVEYKKIQQFGYGFGIFFILLDAEHLCGAGFAGDLESRPFGDTPSRALEAVHHPGHGADDVGPVFLVYDRHGDIGFRGQADNFTRVRVLGGGDQARAQLAAVTRQGRGGGRQVQWRGEEEALADAGNQCLAGEPGFVLGAAFPFARGHQAGEFTAGVDAGLPEVPGDQVPGGGRPDAGGTQVRDAGRRGGAERGPGDRELPGDRRAGPGP